MGIVRLPGAGPRAANWRGPQLVLPDGRVLAGADAVPEILRRIPRWRWLAGLLALPPVRSLSRRVYRWVADNRMRLSCALPRSSR